MRGTTAAEHSVQGARASNLPTGVAITALVAVVALLRLSVFHGRGVDLSDTGSALDDNWLLAFHPEKYRYGATWLTDQFGAWWLKLIGDPGYLHATYLTVVLGALTAASSYLALSAVFRRDVSAVVAAVGIDWSRGGQVSYNTLGAFLLISMIALLLRCRSPKDGRLRPAVFFAAGAIAAVATMVKVSLILSVSVPAVGAMVFGKWHGRREALRLATASAAGFLLSFAAMLAYLKSVGGLSQYLGVFTGGDSLASNPTHQPMVLLRAYALQFLGPALLIVAAALPFVAIRTLGAPRSLRSLTWYAATAAASAALVAWALTGEERSGPLKLAPMIALHVVSVVLAVREWRSPQGRCDRAIVLGLSPLASGCIMAGSATGFHNLACMLPLVFPAVMFTLAPIAVKGSEGSIRRSWPIVAVVAIGIAAIGFRAFNPFRDARNPGRLVAELRPERLRGVRTTPERAAALNELFDELSKRVGKGDTVLAYNYIPGVLYVTETLPATRSSWTEVDRPETIEADLNDLARTGRWPVVSVRALANVRDREWRPGRVVNMDVLEAAYAVIEKWLDENQYRVVWSSGYFEIRARLGVERR